MSRKPKLPKVSLIDRFDPDGKIRKELEDYDLLLSSPLSKHISIQIQGKMKEIKEGLDQLAEWESIAETVGKIGWCFYHRSNVMIYKNAAKHINAGNKEIAEEILTEYWNTNEYLFKWKLKLNRLYSVDDAFLPGCSENGIITSRHEILKEAVALHQAGRYYACIPLILSQLDGICKDVTGKLMGEVQSKKFFGVSSNHLQDVITLAGHHNCLLLIQKLFSTHVTETTPDNAPYRHGIMHGRTLRYGTKANSTKFFVALDAFMYFGWKKVWEIDDRKIKSQILNK